MAMNRRQFLTGLGIAGIAAALSPQIVIAQEAEPTLEDLAKKWGMPLSEVKRIDKEMKQPVMETLKGYAKSICHSDYDKEVFQADLPLAKRKPVMMMFYVDEPDSKDTAGIQYSRGLSSVYKVLTQNFPSKAKFLSYNFYCDDWSGSDEHRNIRKTYDIIAPPSIAMYGTFDLLKGETQQKNDGAIKRVDTLKGGFRKINDWHEWWELLNKWISVNLINPESKILRYENSLEEKFHNL